MYKYTKDANEFLLNKHLNEEILMKKVKEISF
jgi:hypothetical protein